MTEARTSDEPLELIITSSGERILAQGNKVLARMSEDEAMCIRGGMVAQELMRRAGIKQGKTDE